MLESCKFGENSAQYSCKIRITVLMILVLGWLYDKLFETFGIEKPLLVIAQNLMFTYVVIKFSPDKRSLISQFVELGNLNVSAWHILQ